MRRKRYNYMISCPTIVSPKKSDYADTAFSSIKSLMDVTPQIVLDLITTVTEALRSCDCRFLMIQSFDAHSADIRKVIRDRKEAQRWFDFIFGFRLIERVKLEQVKTIMVLRYWGLCFCILRNDRHLVSLSASDTFELFFDAPMTPSETKRIFMDIPSLVIEEET